MKKKLTLIFISALLCLITIYALHKFCIEQNLKIGKFNRNFQEKKITKINEINLPFEVYNFAGMKDNVIYFSSKKLNEILKYDLTTKKFLTKILNHKNHNSNILGDSLFSFDPYFRKMYIYDTNKLDLISEVSLNVGFDRALAVNKNLILLRSATDKYTKTILSTYDIKSNKNNKLKIQLDDSLEVDGGLKTDGYFTYKNSSIIFTQYKKGNFYKIENNLNKINRFKTIDNIQKVEGVNLSKDSTFYFEKPVLNSNLLTSISANKVYIISFVKGNSDKLSDFTKYRMLDVYNLETGKYLESYYLPNDGIEKANDFYIENNKIYLLFNSKISIYEF